MLCGFLYPYARSKNNKITYGVGVSSILLEHQLEQYLVL